MITGLLHLHSSFRYLVLLLIIAAITDALIAMSSGKAYNKTSKLLALGALIFSHIQLLVGLLLYFLGPNGLNTIVHVEGFMKDSVARFYAVEHISMMIIAIALITVGYSRGKKQEESKRKYKTVAIFYGLGLLIIFAMIPWPFMKEFGTWF
jgi:multisubunit Na+/H+ antiporter MnhB subunit